MSRKRASIPKQTIVDDRQATLINISANPKFEQGKLKIETQVHSIQLDDGKVDLERAEAQNPFDIEPALDDTVKAEQSK